jgi:hypothetical protein
MSQILCSHNISVTLLLCQTTQCTCQQVEELHIPIVDLVRPNNMFILSYFVTLLFVPFLYVLFSFQFFVSFRFVCFLFVLFRFAAFRCVSFLFPFLVYRYPFRILLRVVGDD